MAISHSQAAKQAATDAVVDLVDGGAGAGYITICASASVLVTLTCNDPAFGAADANGTATLDVDPAISAAASGTGTADNFKVYDSANTLIFSGTVGTSGTDMTVDNTSINSGQTVTLTSFTYDSAEA
jgi:hypothetical protein